MNDCIFPSNFMPFKYSPKSILLSEFSIKKDEMPGGHSYSWMSVFKIAMEKRPNCPLRSKQVNTLNVKEQICYTVYMMHFCNFTDKGEPKKSSSTSCPLRSQRKKWSNCPLRSKHIECARTNLLYYIYDAVSHNNT